MIFAISYWKCRLWNVDLPLVHRVGNSISRGRVPLLFRNGLPHGLPTCPSLARDDSAMDSQSSSSSCANDSWTSNTDYYSMGGPEADPDVAHWVDSLPSPSTLVGIDEDVTVSSDYALEACPAPKNPADDDFTNWRTVGRRCFPHIMAGLVIPGHMESLPPYTDSFSSPSSPSSSKGSSHAPTLQSRGAPTSTSAHRRPHTTNGFEESWLDAELKKRSSRACPTRRAKTMASIAMAEQLCRRRTPSPRSNASSLKRKRAADARPRSEDRPRTADGDRCTKKARVETRKTPSLPSRTAKTSASIAITFQMGSRR